ncbi:MAG: DUF2442 domain-containing protein [Chloroflexi bacterium]|nr:DUF2442 domain-containing protein [Ardenticatenaceae bacterium]MBL1129266.1 DUF2442 domain-containing protein [Chloroflexota bacterium]NOG35343.1 DUF2442 domain-containing protein [Chloroflexota bacterium]
MDHLLIEVTDFQIVGPFTLSVTFEDGVQHEINFEPVLHGYYYGPLRDQTLFNQVMLDAEIGTLVWPNGADFDPATLYNWHKGEGAELAKRAQNWAKIPLESV